MEIDNTNIVIQHPLCTEIIEQTEICKLAKMIGEERSKYATVNTIQLYFMASMPTCVWKLELEKNETISLSALCQSVDEPVQESVKDIGILRRNAKCENCSKEVVKILKSEDLLREPENIGTYRYVRVFDYVPLQLSQKFDSKMKGKDPSGKLRKNTKRKHSETEVIIIRN